MNSVLRIVLFSCFWSVGFAQHALEELVAITDATEIDTSKVMALEQIAFSFLSKNNDSVMYYARKALEYSNEDDLTEGKLHVYRTLGLAYEQSGNDPMALQSYLDLLKKAESANNEYWEGVAYIRLASFYARIKEYNSTILYVNKARSIYENPENSFSNDKMCFVLSMIGNAFNNLNRPDSALTYLNKAYEFALQRNVESRLPYILGTLGDIHAKLGNDRLALEYYRSHQQKMMESSSTPGYNDGIARIFLKQQQIDSAYHYAKLNFGNVVAKKSEFTQSGADASFLLATIFEEKNMVDSAYHYLKTGNAISDSINSQYKWQQVENYQEIEKERRAQIDRDIAKANEYRHDKLEIILVGLGILIFAVVFILLSQKFITNTKLISYLCITTLLLLFEFFNLLLHPFLDNITNHSALLMLLGLTCIAALLIPAHHRLEKTMIRSMVERNKKFRLAAAKRTLAEFEEG